MVTIVKAINTEAIRSVLCNSGIELVALGVVEGGVDGEAEGEMDCVGIG